MHALKPDLILITPIQANHYQELSEIAPTLHFDVDYKNSQRTHIATVRQHLLTLGRIFDKEALAQQKAAELDAKVEEARRVTAGRPEKAMIVMHNNGAFSAFGVQSRYTLRVRRPGRAARQHRRRDQPARPTDIQRIHPGSQPRHPVRGGPQRRDGAPSRHGRRAHGQSAAAPDQCLEERPRVFVDADAWYITAASVTSLTLLIDDVIKGYRR